MNSLKSLRHSLTIQKRIIHALLMRESLTRYGRHNIGFLWLFVEPMMFTTGVTAIWYATRAFHGTDLPIAAFALTGYSTVLLWRNMPARCINAILPNQALMYHRNVRPLDIYITRLLLEGMGATISFVVLTLFYMSIEVVNPPEDPLMVIFGWLLLAWFGCALAISVGAASERYEMVEKIWHPMAYLIFPLSGAAFLVNALPEAVQGYALLIPMVNGVEMLRDGFFGDQFQAHYDVGYFATFNLCLTLVALAQLSIASREIIPE